MVASLSYFYSIPRGIDHGTLFYDMPICMNGELCLGMVKDIIYSVSSAICFHWSTQVRCNYLAYEQAAKLDFEANFLQVFNDETNAFKRYFVQLLLHFA